MSAGSVHAPLQPAHRRYPPASARHPFHPKSVSQTDKTITKLSKIIHSDRAISLKSLGFRQFRLATEDFLGSLSTSAPAQMRERGREERSLPLHHRRFGRFWIRLNKTEQPEHLFPRKTLGIAARRLRRKIPAEHLNTESRCDPRI